MCGIAGIWDKHGQLSGEALTDTASRMAEAIMHRGPDDSGLWHDAAQGLALSHRRLSIIDLSPHGHQPMPSACGRYVLCFNGEIYNFRSLRAQLNYPFKGESDSEVLLAALSQWGIERSLNAAHGMFAFALWDAQEQTLTLARDRIGEKPFYYGVMNGAFAFASELHALRSIKGFAPNINRNALAQFMGCSYVGAPHSIYEGIHKLPAGHYVQLSNQNDALQIKPYWQLKDTLAQGQQHPLLGSAEALTDQLDALLGDAVKNMMVSDVPLGAFLSGGIDSSTIVALMQKHTQTPVKTFSIGFAEKGFDEAPYAKAVATHLGTDHTELYVSAGEALNVIPSLGSIYDEPFADDSQIPTYLVAKMAREHVTVALSGDAGDEFFGGYTRYRRGVQLWNAVRWMPANMRQILAEKLISPAASSLSRLLPAQAALLQRVAHYATKLSAKDKLQFYQQLCQTNHEPLALGAAIHAPNDELAHLNLPYAQWMMAQDALSYLPNDILVKVDRAAMAVSLETRIPFLDPAVMDFACALPPEMKIKNGQGKWLLRQLLYRHVPRTLIDRPKAGFAIPLAQWLRGELNDWANDLLAPDLLRRQGYLDANRIAKLWQQHQAGTHNHQGALWNALMFQSWIAEQQR